MCKNIDQRYEKLRDDFQNATPPSTLQTPPITSQIMPTQTVLIAETKLEENDSFTLAEMVTEEQPMTTQKLNSQLILSTLQFHPPVIPMAALAFNVHDDFCINSLRICAEIGRFLVISDAFKEIKRVVRIDQSLNYFVKEKTSKGTYVTKILSKSEGTALMKSITIFKNGRKKATTMFDVIEETGFSKLMVTGCRFFSLDPNILSIFTGYNRKILPHTKQELHYLYHQLVFEGICNSVPLVFNYINKWIALYLQNPGKKTGTALVLKGLPDREVTNRSNFSLSLPHHSQE
jgi:hypothetical protein